MTKEDVKKARAGYLSDIARLVSGMDTLQLSRAVKALEEIQEGKGVEN
jgi:hypothetical protein